MQPSFGNVRSKVYSNDFMQAIIEACTLMDISIYGVLQLDPHSGSLEEDTSPKAHAPRNAPGDSA